MLWVETQHPLRKSVTQTQKNIATIATMRKSCGSLQVCVSGFRACKTKQTYETMSHTSVSNHAAEKQTIYDHILSFK